MTVATQTIRCPYCKEPINAQATICKHCHSDLSNLKKPKKSYFSKYNNFRTGFLSGILFSLILLILWLIYIYSPN
ncbi:MAG: zinc ribbon domain-containing protein [Candidatus Zixiibacteriota bacterium]